MTKSANKVYDDGNRKLNPIVRLRFQDQKSRAAVEDIAAAMNYTLDQFVNYCVSQAVTAIVNYGTTKKAESTHDSK